MSVYPAVTVLITSVNKEHTAWTGTHLKPFLYFINVGNYINIDVYIFRYIFFASDSLFTFQYVRFLRESNVKSHKTGNNLFILTE